MNKPNIISICQQVLQEEHGYKPEQIKQNYAVSAGGTEYVLDLVIMNNNGVPLAFMQIKPEKLPPGAFLQNILEATGFYFGFAVCCRKNYPIEVYGMEKDVLAGGLVTYRHIVDKNCTNEWMTHLVNFLHYFS